VELAAKKNTSN